MSSKGRCPAKKAGHCDISGHLSGLEGRVKWIRVVGRLELEDCSKVLGSNSLLAWSQCLKQS